RGVAPRPPALVSGGGVGKFGSRVPGRGDRRGAIGPSRVNQRRATAAAQSWSKRLKSDSTLAGRLGDRSGGSSMEVSRVWVEKMSPSLAGGLGLDRQRR